MPIPHWLSAHHLEFPDPRLALSDPNGLLAIGGDLSPERLLQAYRQGIFPWYNDDQPILWWSPDPRAVLFPKDIKVNRSLQKTLRNKQFKVTIDTAFSQVIRACSLPRPQQSETWINDEMMVAYNRLHQLGYAHSYEVWFEEQLVGGLYGVILGKVFFGESMFSTMPDASKVALVNLARECEARDFDFIDCQLPNPFLLRMGAVLIPRAEFLERLAKAVK
jgi:leucyl/phenylalanyl-tRNA---protein transferase